MNFEGNHVKVKIKLTFSKMANYLLKEKLETRHRKN